MFDGIPEGTEVRIHFAGSTQQLAMRVRYNGTSEGLHSLSGLGAMSGVDFTATDSALTNGRALSKVEVV